MWPLAFHPLTTTPLEGWIAVVLALWAIVRGWDFMARRGWRWTIADWLVLTFAVGLILALLRAH